MRNVILLLNLLLITAAWSQLPAFADAPGHLSDPAHEQAHRAFALSSDKSEPPAAPQQNETAAETDSIAEALPAALQVRHLPPLEEMVTSPFGPRRMPTWLSRRGMVVREHSGVDLRARLGWPVVAYKGGEVIRSGEDGLSGIVVDIRQDDGMTARYAHLEKTLARKGQKVQRGEKIGIVGCTGRTTGAHLHFGLRDAAGNLVDPLPFLSRAEDVLRPAPDAIPDELTPQSCGPVMRGRNGRPGRSLKELENYNPPPIPGWGEKPSK
ncbi:M23 family metallopeptidase [Desulfovibrio sp.]|uniref:M23 family metallopeptidase n=1 Tax=Desulfovibrio sp. TaxID=885 RepID=UPI0025BEF088|nr:M23 family metallopeptidase [Desulfovibrio sp.]